MNPHTAGELATLVEGKHKTAVNFEAWTESVEIEIIVN